MAASSRKPRRRTQEISLEQEQPQMQDFSELMKGVGTAPRAVATPEGISFPTDMILNVIISYLEKHPEILQNVIERLVEQGVAALMTWLNSLKKD